MIRRTIEMAAAMGIGHKVLFTGFLRGGDVDKVRLRSRPKPPEPHGVLKVVPCGILWRLVKTMDTTHPPSSQSTPRRISQPLTVSFKKSAVTVASAEFREVLEVHKAISPPTSPYNCFLLHMQRPDANTLPTPGIGASITAVP